MSAAGGRFAAADLGASSGRVVVGSLTPDRRVELGMVHRFPNQPARMEDGLHWDVAGLFEQVLEGLHRAGPVDSVAVDSWAVDHGLVGTTGGGTRGLLHPPFHYRDDRCQRGVERVHAKIGPAELYRINGLQHLPFTTCFQLAAEAPGWLEAADRMLLVPDLLASWLCGVEVTERTNASTTGLLDPLTRGWNLDLMRRLGLPTGLLAPLVDPGTRLGSLLPAVAERVGYSSEVVAVASHDTASAVAAVPAVSYRFAYISCGTWGLVGLELHRPVITEDARLAGFTNEGGLGGTTRFLHNVMGLWLITECLRAWGAADDLEGLLAEAGRLPVPVGLVDVDDDRFLAPNDAGRGTMPDRLDDWCRDHALPVPTSRAGTVRLVVESLAAAFADAVRRAAALAGHEVEVVHLVGGGAQNGLLCQLTADRVGLPVVAGPVEATALGNLLVQARVAGLLGDDPAELRAVVARSTVTHRYLPSKGRR
ncbi:rhamnulokinase [Aestuariimicrobium kwangyangense]|uniref:rhamnulokinase n=1 Tax=Aestuariimicrobium kwangyangense TaxID=396389 RepID=UPI00047B7342|nr:rhamnulokinase family protein [Aestuariimicrobium kwangyangense]